MAGSISLSLSQQFDSLGKPLNGGLLYTYAAGTTTPQSAYQDSGLTIPLPNPITLDSAGRIPQLFFADGSIKIRLTDSRGVVQIAADGILVIGASSGGGGGSPVDATTILQTGQLVHWYGTGPQSGFVRCNGRTIGGALSGATERANADCQSLFTFLWQQDSNLSVSTGRGADAASDWAANKTITLPDGRGRALSGLDDMGNSAASRLTSSWFGATATTLGAVGGNEKNALSATNQLPQFTPAGTISTNAGGAGTPSVVQNGAAATLIRNDAALFNVYGINAYAQLSATFSGTSVGSASPSSFTTIGPRLLATIYIKL